METKIPKEPVRILLNRNKDYRIKLDRFPIGETRLLEFEGEASELVLRTSESENGGALVSVTRVPQGIKDRAYEIFQGYVFVRCPIGTSIMNEEDKDYASINEWMEEHGF